MMKEGAGGGIYFNILSPLAYGTDSCVACHSDSELPTYSAVVLG